MGRKGKKNDSLQEFKINILMHWLIWKEIIDIMISIFWKESLNSDDQQFHQYQQNEQ